MDADQPSLFAEPESELGDLAEATSLLTLMEAPGIGPVKAIALARGFGSWTALSKADDEALVAVAGKSAAGLQQLRRTRPASLPEGVRLVGFFDEDFPTALRTIPQPPAVLWVRGTTPARTSIAIVGTRNPTPAGADMAGRLAQTAVEAHWGVVSGLALGIDIAAHRATLDAGGTTWAFLGSGVNRVTPAVHRDAAEEIVAAGGGLLAEVPPGTETSPRFLVARDRLQSGSSRATVIAQSGIPSGTLHTARFTIEQGHTLAVVSPPGDELADPAWAGNLALLDRAGCDPSVLSASGSLAKRIVQRHPAADTTIGSVGDLARLLQELHAR